MPLHPLSRNAGDQPDRFLRSPGPLHFLLANDNPQEIKEASISLRRGFPACRIEAVYSAPEALEWASSRPWHLILLDEALTRARERNLIADLRRLAPRASLLLQTGCNDIAVAMRALQAGADHCLFKHAPSFPAELPGAVETLLRRERPARRDSTLEGFLELLEPRPAFLFELDEEGRFVYVSPPVEAALGYRPQELVGRPCSVLLHPGESLQADRRFRERRTGTRATRRFALRLAGRKSADGEERGMALELDATGLYAPNGRFLGTLGLFRDPAAERQEASHLVTEAGVLAGLAGAVLVDLQALLIAVAGYGEILLAGLGPAGEPGRRRLEEVKGAGMLAADLARQLLVLSGVHSQPFPAQVNLAVGSPREEDDR